VEIAPRKSYTRPVIETACATYADPSRPTITLRQTVEQLGKNAPHASSLHGWLGALGARALAHLLSLFFCILFIGNEIARFWLSHVAIHCIMLA
jgi:hypothetical protein